jgi:hypothetical protein
MQSRSVSKKLHHHRYDCAIPSAAKRLNIASIRFGGSFAPPFEPPGHYGHESANDILDEEFARDVVGGVPAVGRGKFIPHQVGKYLADLAKADGAAAAADERAIKVDMVASMFEHGQAEAQASLFNLSGHCLSFSLPIDELFAQMLEAFPL